MLVRWFFAFFSPILCVGFVGATDLPLVPFPDNVRIRVVGEDLHINGLPLMAYEFVSPDSKEGVAKFYRDTWSDNAETSDVEDTPFIETKLGDWLVLSRLEKDHNITIQLKDMPDNSTHVLVGVSPLPKYLKEDRKNIYEIRIPKLLGMQIISTVASKDRGKVSEIYWIDSNREVESTLDEFKQYYDSHGGSTKGLKLESQEGRADYLYGTLNVTTDKESIRFDAVKLNKKTRVIALWQPI